MIKNILLDLDGTLVDTAADLANAINILRQSYNLPELPIDIIRPTVSLGAAVMIKLGFDLEQGQQGYEEIHKKFLEIYSENIAHESRLYDGMEEVLERLDKDKKLWGIVTNKASWLAIPLLKKLSLEKRAACIVCGDTVGHNKPHPAPVMYACKLMASEPSSTIFIGDAKRDIEAGQKAGTKTLVALYGYISENDNPESWGANGMISSPNEILAAINSL